MKYISPGGWFSLEYPENWNEFKDTEDTFLFYNSINWEGNFRISAFKGSSSDYANCCIKDELKTNSTSVSVKIGQWNCAYSSETFQENGAWYTTHIWITGFGQICFECTFTVEKGGKRMIAEEIIRSIKVRNGHEPKEIIPIRILEIEEINEAFEWVSNRVKKLLTKDFTSQEDDIYKLQALVNDGKIQLNQRNAWESIGLTLGTIMENEMDGINWVTVVDNDKEYAALQFKDLLIDPMNWIWNQVKSKASIDLKSEFIRIKEEVEKRL